MCTDSKLVSLDAIKPPCYAIVEVTLYDRAGIRTLNYRDQPLGL